ncbi:hypothetical protein ACH5RR_035878 [Cinchona calisaya]|uniref:EF-hand domain-containing protein n=1 Tax=Cinchona calisaya TaxID=153742 RepID=A0ABD2Y535_9GENT
MRTKLCNTKIVDTSPLEKLNDGEICLEEMKIVMDRLGISCQEEDIEENWVAGVSDFSEMLVDEEPSLLEIKQVFQVFDENRDGFIDASELRRVLCGLCLIKEGSKLEECRKMVCAFDQNEDGLLDFEEFVAFMDKCFH